MKYEINPCKACLQKYQNTSCNINDINNCVTETAAAFAGIPSNNFLDYDARQNWSDCMKSVMAKDCRSFCDLRLDMAPVFVQTPHYFPSLLSKEKNKKDAFKSCILMCDGNKDCQNSCKLDYTAVSEVYDDRNSDTEIYDDRNADLAVTQENNKSNLSFGIYMGIGLIILLTIICLILCVKQSKD